MTHVHVAAARNISSAVDVQNRIYTDFKSAGQIALRFLTFFAVNSFVLLCSKRRDEQNDERDGNRCSELDRQSIFFVVKLSMQMHTMKILTLLFTISFLVTKLLLWRQFRIYSVCKSNS